jgi:pimeloyl-ACP methyl ester carboxylesterase
VLNRLLQTAAVKGPFVLVAHSWGGFIATTYARSYPRQVVGMVLIDPGSQYLKTVLPAGVWSTWMRTIASVGKQHPQAERPDYPASIAFLATLPKARPVPAVVLTSDEPIDFLGTGEAVKYHPDWVHAQTLLAKNLGGTQITDTHSGHFIQSQNPGLVIQQTSALLTAIRHQRRN